jgi:TonB family protein
MTRFALCAASALLCLATLPALAAVQEAAPPAAKAREKPATQVAPSPALMAFSKAVQELTARQATMPYAAWLDTLPGFRFSPATSSLLIKQFGTDRLFSVTRNVPAAGGRNYVLTVPTRRRDNPDGSSFAWSAMQGQIAAQPDGAFVSTFSAPRFVTENGTFRLEARDMAYAGTARNDDALPVGEGVVELGSLEMTEKADGAGTRMDGMSIKFSVKETGGAVDLVNDIGARTLAIHGERIDDPHIGIRLSGLDKTAVETFIKLSKQMSGSAPGSAKVHETAGSGVPPGTAMAPLMRQLGLAVLARGAAIELDDISFSYRGSKASVHGQLHLENATADDLEAGAKLLKKVAGHIDVQVPVAMLHALADSLAGKQLAQQHPGADAATIAALGTTIYDGMLRAATASGYVRVDGDMLVTAVDIRDGVILLNGKPFQFPATPAPAPVGAVDSAAGAGRLMRARRIADKCALPDFPPDVVAQDRALSMSMQLTVQADGTVTKLMLARSSGLPAYDKAVLAAAAQCTYIPALLDGKPVTVPATWTIVRTPGSVHP